MNTTQVEALRHLLRRADEVRGLVDRTDAPDATMAPDMDTVLETIAELVQELERSHRRLIETNVQLVSLREVANSTVGAPDSAEMTRTVTRYLCRAFGFDEGVLLLVDRDNAILDGTWTHRGEDGDESHSISLPLLGDHGALARAMWLRRTVVHHAPGPHVAAVLPPGHPMHEVLQGVGSTVCVPLLRSRSETANADSAEACGPRCMLGDSTLLAPPPGPSSEDWAIEREERQRRCLACPRMPVLGVIGMARRRDAPPVGGNDITMIESIALSVAPLVENTRLYFDLRKSERFREHVLDSIASALIAVNMRREVLTFNRHAEEMLGWAETDVLGRPFGELFGPDGERLLMDALEHGREGRRVETILRSQDGSVMPVRMNTTLLRDERLAIHGAIATFLDLTPLRRAEEHAARLDRLAALGRFTSSVAHEIRNPLAGIGAGIQYLSRAIDPQGPHHENLAFIHGEIRRLDRIVQDLFDITHPRGLQIRTMPIESTLRLAVQCLDSTLQEKNLRTVVSIAPRTPPVPHDTDQIEQVLINLVKNAAEASPTGATLTLTVAPAPDPVPGEEREPAGPAITVRVQDEGCGISPENLKTIFEPFFTTKPGGSGLGLYISHDIVKRHGGSLTVTSELGRGTAFVVALPLDHTGGKS